MMARGEIWLMNSELSVSRDVKKSHECVVISPPELHEHLHTVMVAPLMTRGYAAPFRIAISYGGKTRLILLDQLRTVDKTQLHKRLGALPPKTLLASLDVLREMFTY